MDCWRSPYTLTKVGTTFTCALRLCTIIKTAVPNLLMTRRQVYSKISASEHRRENVLPLQNPLMPSEPKMICEISIAIR